MKLAIHVVLSVVLTVMLVALWLIVAEALDWRPFGSVMVHGGFVGNVLPICFVVANVAAFFGTRFAAKRWDVALRRSRRLW